MCRKRIRYKTDTDPQPSEKYPCFIANKHPNAESKTVSSKKKNSKIRPEKT